MTKRKQFILVIAVLLVAFCSFVYLKKQFFSPSKPKEESRKETIVYDSSLKDITLTKDGRYVLVSPKDVNWQSNDLRMSRNYVVSTFTTYEQFYAKKNTLPSGKLVKFDIITYDLRKKNFVEKRIDLKKAVEEYDSDYGLRYPLEDFKDEYINFVNSLLPIWHSNSGYLQMVWLLKAQKSRVF